MTNSTPSKQLHKKWYASPWLALCLAIILLAAVSLATSILFAGVKVDVTEDKLYTLSEGTLATLRPLEEPVNLTLYYSESIGQQSPPYGQFAERVKDLLREYQRRAGGNIRLSIVNPEPFSPEEDAALAAGLQSAKVTQDGDTLYFGLIGTNSVGEDAKIPFFFLEREAFIEYDLTSLVAKLAADGKPTLGLISTLPLAGEPQMLMQTGQPAQPWVVYQQLQQFFDIQDLGLEATNIPADLDALFLVQPTGLSDASLYAIDQYLVRGGRALLMVDPVPEYLQAKRTDVPLGNDDNLNKLLNMLGVVVNADEFIGDLGYARSVTVPTDTYKRQISYLGWPLVTQKSFNKTHPALGQLKAVAMATPGYLQPVEESSVNFLPLITSSNKAMAMEADLLKPAANPERLLQAFEATGEEYPLAAQLTGRLQSTFDKAPDDADKTIEFTSNGEKPATVVVIADSDILVNELWVQVGQLLGQTVTVPSADNGPLISNTLELLAGGGELVGLRSRGVTARPFTRLENLQKSAEAKFKVQEERIATELRKTESQLQDLLAGGGGGESALILTDEQQSLIDSFQDKVVELRQNLRGVQRNLRQDVEQLRYLLLFVNIALVPLVLVLVALVAVRRNWRLFYKRV